MPEFEGVLTLHSETGTEGGYWALQDRDEIKLITPDFGVFGHTDVWDQVKPERHGMTQDDCEVLKAGEWMPIPDPLTKEEDYVRSSLFRGDRGDRDADQRLMEKYDFRIIYPTEAWDEKWGPGNWHWEDEHHQTAVAPDGTRYASGGTPLTEPRRPYGVGSGELTRMTVLWDDGEAEQRLSDSLLIERWSYNGLKVLQDGDHLTIYDEGQTVWEGEIKFRQFELFTESASGMWIHADQEGVDRDTWAAWFFARHKAKLRRNDPHMESPQMGPH